MSRDIQAALRAQLHDVTRLSKARTLWTVFSYEEDTGRLVQAVSMPNLITYEGADILARLLAGDEAYKPARIYFEFDNDESPATPTEPTDRSSAASGSAYYASAPFVRSPFAAPPTISTSDEDDYAGNQATFSAVSSNGDVINGDFGSEHDSHVLFVALAAAPTGSAEDDLVFSRAAVTTPIPKLDGLGIGAQYLIRFL